MIHVTLVPMTLRISVLMPGRGREVMRRCCAEAVIPVGYVYYISMGASVDVTVALK